MAVPESQLVVWTIEKNEDGKHALFLRLAGQPYQMTDWFEHRDDLIATLRLRLAGH